MTQEDLDGYGDVRRALKTPIAGGENEYTLCGFRELLARRCIDIAQPDLCAAGGFSGCRHIVALAHAHGVQVNPHVWGSAVGQAASLQLVRSAIHDRDAAQVRSFVASLSGAEGHLYEYLAEEVIGDLPEPLQVFLMRTSVLETVDLTLGPVAADLGMDETRALIEEAENQQQQGGQSSSSASSSSSSPQEQPRQSQAAGEQAGQGDNTGERMPPAREDGSLRPQEAADLAAWGALPARVRDALMQGAADKYSTMYQRLTESYYRRLAEERRE